MHAQPTCLIIGAGLAGLFAARTLQRRTCRSTILEKARGVGGRLASRRQGEMTFDHGAQHLQARTSAFAEHLREAEQAGVVRQWSASFPGSGTAGYTYATPVLCGTPAMTSFPKHLAVDLSIHLEQRVTSARIANDAWSVETESGHVFMAQALVMTAPLPQALAILEAGEVRLPSGILTVLKAPLYRPVVALLIGLERESGIPEPGALVVGDGPVAWIADNHVKGVSAAPGALTVHATEEFSAAHFAASDDTILSELLPHVRRIIRVPVQTVHIHRWRYARPASPLPGPFLAGSTEPPLVFAGDVFGTGDAEAAALSGVAAAEHLHSNFCPGP